jgi:hypothetical protein
VACVIYAPSQSYLSEFEVSVLPKTPPYALK